MKQSLYSKFVQLVKDYTVGDSNDTNILDVIHLSENDHTNILWQILSFRKDGEYPYLKSFFDKVLHLRYDNYFNVDGPLLKGSGTQYAAIPVTNAKKEKGNDAKGFIDLLLKGHESVVIIENKVCGAADADCQLVRYYHSFAELDNNDSTKGYHDKIKPAYDKYYSAHKSEYGKENIFVVYLTKDGKEPDPQSVWNLQDQIGDHFIQIGYLTGNENHKSILDWLKEDVLPNICYLEGGHLSQSVMIYIDYIENALLGENNTDEYTSDLRHKDLFRGCSVSDLIKEYRDNASIIADEVETREFASQYAKCLMSFINKKINDILSKETFFSGWRLHWRPGWFMIYKNEWSRFGTGRVINLVHWEMLKNMDSAADYKWSFHMEGKKLADLAKQYEPEWQHIFSKAKTINGSGQIQRVSDFNINHSSKYLFDLPDQEIIQYFKDLLCDQQFIDLTDKAVKELDKRFRP